MMDQIKIEAPAKINLTLKVVAKRLDGYHDLETVMQQIDLCDEIIIESVDEGIEVNSNNSEVPVAEANLAFKAARLLCERIGVTRGFRIFIDKKIPLGAGLAGGSTDAAAVLRGLNQILDFPLDLQTLLELGLQVGSDVPFCIVGGTALARGRGEILESLSLGPHLELVLVNPPLQISTAEVYHDLKLAELNDQPDNGAFLEAWYRCDIIGLAAHMKNDLETVSVVKYPGISEIKDRLVSLGALGTFMSGSGPSVIGIFGNRQMASKAWQTIKEVYQESFLVSSYIKDKGGIINA
ncbi:MAG: 4-(cytidine 5'-diphospho)-2-C-methyl-D-erythritol kinase [Syntrophomonadaceae bacterium]|nr:4-(cytidine 5'-diphospho)-2-C-methyl-D-erythritol kinase [Syntrophomonadaceae bacterium]